MERLQKYLARSGVASRRKCELLITEGRVKVNGKIITELGVKIDPFKDQIEVDNTMIKQQKSIYLLLNKPVGYITTMDDQFNRKTVKELVDSISQRVFPVGRLDKDSEGLLIMTNDGELAYKLTHPKFYIEKTYLLTVNGHLSSQSLNDLRQGIKLEDGVTSPAKVELLEERKKTSIIEINIHEGRNRQIRRMFDQIGHPVIKLKRTKISFLNLGDLKKGTYRHMTKEEVYKLREIVSESYF